MSKCSCGSGEEKYPLYDGHRIFLCYVCDECEEGRLSEFRADIFEPYECDEPIEEDE